MEEVSELKLLKLGDGTYIGDGTSMAGGWYPHGNLYCILYTSVNV